MIDDPHPTKEWVLSTVPWFDKARMPFETTALSSLWIRDSTFRKCYTQVLCIEKCTIITINWHAFPLVEIRHSFLRYALPVSVEKRIFANLLRNQLILSTINTSLSCRKQKLLCQQNRESARKNRPLPRKQRRDIPGLHGSTCLSARDTFMIACSCKERKSTRCTGK